MSTYLWWARDTVQTLLPCYHIYENQQWDRQQQPSAVLCFCVYSSVVHLCQRRVIDDVTQQGFSRRYYTGAGISMEPSSPFSVHRFGPPSDPNLLKGPPDHRNPATVQAPGDELCPDPRSSSSLFILRCHPLPPSPLLCFLAHFCLCV